MSRYLIRKAEKLVAATRQSAWDIWGDGSDANTTNEQIAEGWRRWERADKIAAAVSDVIRGEEALEILRQEVLGPDSFTTEPEIVALMTQAIEKELGDWKDVKI